nr:LrgB family protein [Ameyamaea chiangmaiensis]
MHDLANDPTVGTLVWLCVTLAAFLGGVALQVRLRGAPWANPVLVAIGLVCTALVLSHTPYEVYFRAVAPIHFLLGPATVALAVPLAASIGHVMRSLGAMTAALLAGAVTSLVGGVALVVALHGDHIVALSMAPKAVTTPIAIAIAGTIGGQPALTASFAILGGIVAAMVGEPLLHRLGIRDWRAHGLAAGIAGSGIAAAQVARRDPLGAAFAALGIGLNGLVTSLLAPLLLRFLR